MRYGHIPKEIADFTNESRQTVSYHLGILLKNKMIYDTTKSSNKWKIYRLTELGQKVLAQYEGIEKKELKGIENARWICIVKNTKRLQKFLFENGFKVHSMGNWNQWVGEIQGFSIAVNEARLTKLMITHPPSYSGDLQSAFKKVSENILTVIGVLNKKYDLDLSIPEPIQGRQFTMANGIADYLLDITNGSQIKLMNGKISIDASKKGEPRIEFDEITEAQEFANMPKIVAELKATIEESNRKHEIQTELILQSMNTLLKQNQTTLDTLATIVSGKNEGKLEQNIEPKEFKDSFGMFG
ncbi:MAG: winged helix-turn-helix domain-containing protein [Nitrosopumilus sp.]|uniref:winged helix-turn-helix domain-containing protein n=1 Tax=Nitrosopumilus sp. TaxID=2024843 RepID=UPI00247D5B32|nr:winged helix-turn-helix domain-containing protein [Nitrosopumilus sp.]MCV0393718.1 winged helix-turn-helix domain-containing protein [Nitrosopumilus sp.]